MHAEAGETGYVPAPSCEREEHDRVKVSEHDHAKVSMREGILATCLASVFPVCNWLVAAIRMYFFVVLLLPGFLQLVVWYIMSPRISRSIAYGPGCRQRVDLYWSSGTDRKAARSRAQKLPVVIYITGGAWMVGYRAWGALLAKRLSQQGVLVACLDYRNFPQASAVEMLEDVNRGIVWVLDHIEQHGGDPQNVILVGQSAGAHLGTLALFSQAEQAASGSTFLPASPPWNPDSLRAFVAVSGIYDLNALSQHLIRRGLTRGALVESVMTIAGRPALQELSPLEAAKTWAQGTAELLPEIILVHGTADQSAPHDSACHMIHVLKEQNVPCSLTLLEGKGHTSLILEDPMKGGRDELTHMVLQSIPGHGQEVLHARMNPGFMCDLASMICPF